MTALTVDHIRLAGVKLLHAQTEDARRSLIPFARRMFPGYDAAAHHLAIAERLEAVARGDLDRLIITMPPRHGKSVLASQLFPAWYLGNHPTRRIIGCSHTASLAYMFSRRARNAFADPRWPFPGVRLSDDAGAVQSWEIAGHRGGYVAAGVGGAITGVGANVLLIDDPVKSAAEADSQTFRDRAWEWYTGTAATRLEPNGAVVVIGTRWQDDDLIGRLLQQSGWEHLLLPAISADGEALWPKRYNVAALNRIKREIGSRNFQAQYQGDPVPSEGGMFKRSWWRRYREAPALSVVELYVDSAFKEGTANDYSVIACWGVSADGELYLLRLWRERVAFPGLLRLCHDAHAWAKARYPDKTTPLVIEDKASGQSAIQTLRQPFALADGVRLPGLPVIAYRVTDSKVARADAATPVVEAGRVYVPEDAEWLDDFLTEHERFPLGAHDDMVDTTAMSIARLSRAGGSLGW